MFKVTLSITYNVNLIAYDPDF